MKIVRLTGDVKLSFHSYPLCARICTMSISNLAAWPIIGHTPAVRLLQRSLVEERLAHAYLLVGPPNVGKTTVGLTFAQALLCDDASARATGSACGVCAACRKVRERSHPDLRLIEPEGSADDVAAGLGDATESGSASKSSKRKAASRTQIK